VGCGAAEVVMVMVEAAVVQGVRRRNSDRGVRACIFVTSLSCVFGDWLIVAEEN
jgi:hypothetical protein